MTAVATIHLVGRMLMIERIPDLPDNVVGVSASGQVDAADYETVLIPAIDAAHEKHDQIRLLYEVGPQFTGFTAAAMWDDIKVGIAHFRAWEKIAVVTDHTWIANMTRMFGFAIPCPVKIFLGEALAEAKTWIAA
ncbi:SpoIIAA family protein [Denitromonas iodatirespirans]|uniref:STAS/SEC14 domain-containing protein n=1 Tax=Denitromonas iodatirespirans TaxID=2795389 RepID=A0A944H8S1_DENI1|nr:STAS/SEC14 domain-containing protein [Denitromonas iodatirespirans]MBT0962618.1 STAS/SEC14 domain-containing protein [Denitromonas iodatirespirans]